jgi:hypothetical protein
MSISQNFPEEGPTLNLNFAGSRTLDPRITFTRTSSATYMGRDGLVKIAPANSARFDHRYNSTTGEVESLGLLVEEQRSNLITYSEDFRDFDTSITWENFGINVELNSTTSPDGKLNGTKLINTAGTASRRVNSPLLTVTSGVTYTHSVWLKAGEYTTATVFCNTTAVNPNFNNLSARINLVTGVVSGTINTPITVISYPNGWWRISSTFTTDENTATTGLLSIVPNTDAGGVNSVVGDGTSGIYIWGAQLEQGSFPTSYIPTTTSTATRTADNASITGSNFTNWYNQSEGTVVSNISFPVPRKSTRFSCPISFNDNTINNRIISVINSDATSNYLGIAVADSNISQANANTQVIDSILSFKKILTYKENNFAYTFSGLNPILDTSGTVPINITQAQIGLSPGISFLNGHIAQLTYYPQRLQNSQLITLTK